MGFTVDDNLRTRRTIWTEGPHGPAYVGDAVCVPLAALFADMITGVEDFLAKKKSGVHATGERPDRPVHETGGTVPAGLSQYIHVFKLAFCNVFGRAEVPCPAEGEATVRCGSGFWENISSSLDDRGDV